MLTKRKLAGLLVIMVILLGVATAAVGSGFINIVNPENPAIIPAIVPPQLAPPGQTGYTNQPAKAVITAPDKRPVAQFAAPPVDLAQGLAVNFPHSRPEQDSTIVAFAILASVRYTGNGQTVLVTTARPSSAAAQQPISLGNQTIKLDDGSTAWAMTGIPTDTPNQVVFLRNDLIITVASDLPINVLRDLAGQVIIK